MPRTMLLAALVTAVLFAAATAVSLFVGARAVDPQTVWQVVTGLPGTGAATMDEAVVAARVPRTLTAVLVGAALAVAGAGLQGATRNPLG
ncbi:MAG TPA: iron chelate uptake ABC transporter family permease subunit, partial [Actinomycetales bacterium]|nr:iron chelate uptake ABC transporter family permease subunit [Actinomycetales bacterium]